MSELAYYLCAGPPGTTDDGLIRAVGARWAIEECFQTAKNEVGLDHYQLRRYDAWYRHITLASGRPGPPSRDAAFHLGGSQPRCLSVTAIAGSAHGWL